MITAHRNKHSKYGENSEVLGSRLYVRKRAYKGNSGTESICAIINLCSENITVLSTKKITKYTHSLIFYWLAPLRLIFYWLAAPDENL